jgi:hypothetical protein
MFVAVLCTARSQVSNVNFISFNPVPHVLTFGFEAGSTFRFDFECTPPGHVRGLLLSPREMAASNSSQFGLMCSGCDFSIAAINFSGSIGEQKSVWEGVISERGVYTLFLWNCELGRTTFCLTATTLNPLTQLDTHHIMMPQLYLMFCVAYSIMALIWIVNTLCFLRFRVPLHTLFVLVPIIRALSMAVSRGVWVDLGVSERPRPWRMPALSLLGFAFYTVTLAGISFACAGLSIFRRKVGLAELLEMIVTAMLVSASYVGVEYVISIPLAFMVMGMISFSTVWYIKQATASAVLVTGLMKQMKDEPQVLAKVTLARSFAADSSITVVITWVIWIITVESECQKWLSASILELGLLLNTAWQMKYFLLRKEYLNGVCEPPPNRKMAKRPKILIDPVRSVLVILTECSG